MSSEGIGATRSEMAQDLSLLVLLAGLLTAIHVLVPGTVQARLAFDHEAFNLSGLYTSAFVHSSDAHLFGNVLGYLLTASYTYWLCLEAHVRRWFRRTFVALPLVLPPLVTLTSYAVYRYRFGAFPAVERGFSGVVAGFGGFLLVALAVYLEDRFGDGLGYRAGVAVFLLLLVEIDVIYAGVEPLVAGLALLGVVVLFGDYARQHGPVVGLGRGRWNWVRSLLLVGLVLLVLSYVVVALFPARIAESGDLTNVVGHAAGFVYGGVLAVAAGFDVSLEGPRSG
jgi:hypothetical protein